MAKKRKPINEADLTPWFPPDVKPVHVGEYNASQFRLESIRRWWDGQDWSAHYIPSAPESVKSKRRATKELRVLQRRIGWRGLSKKPE